MPLGKSRLSLGGIRGRFGSFTWLRTIRSRLYLAFGLAAALTVVGSSFALFASANISATLREIVSRSMPATVESFRLSEDTNSLIGSAPRLIAVQDESQRAEIAGRNRRRNPAICRPGSSSLRALDASESDEIAVAQAAMDERLERAQSKRSPIASGFPHQRRALALAVRKAHENLLETITPAIDDANFDLMTKSQAEDRTTLNRVDRCTCDGSSKCRPTPIFSPAC